MSDLARAQLEVEERLRAFFGDMRQRLSSMLRCDAKDLLARDTEFESVARLLEIAVAETNALSWLAGSVGSRVGAILAEQGEEGLVQETSR